MTELFTPFPPSYTNENRTIAPLDRQSSWSQPTLARVEAIIALENTALRNLYITQTYHDLKIGLTRVLGTTNVSWCAYATWASKTAGRFIRKEYLPAMMRTVGQFVAQIDDVLRWVDADGRLEQFLLTEMLENIMDEVSRNVVWGNLTVFEELAPLYTRMIEMFSYSTTYDQVELNQFLAYLKPGSVHDGGQDYLIRAFTHYYEAIFEDDPKAKAELIFLANLLVGYHEQTRLQETIVRALGAPIFTGLVDGLCQVVMAATPTFLRERLATTLEQVLTELANNLIAEWRAIATRWFIALELPGRRLDVGRDVPSPTPGAMFPRDLATLRHPELLALLNTLDRTPNTSVGSAARDWSCLADRMNFVVDFFRIFQQTETLYQQPFSDPQVYALHAGYFPSGSL